MASNYNIHSLNACIKCNLNKESALLKLSCGHILCEFCIQKFIGQTQSDFCPKCSVSLASNMQTLLMTHKKSNSSFNPGDILWTYEGRNGNQWLYTKDQCDLIESSFTQYEMHDSDTLMDISLFTLDINPGNSYILDFEEMVQYPSNDSTKKRSLNRIIYGSEDDIVDNNIVGISGKKF